MTRERAEREGRGGRRTLDPLDHVHARRDLAEGGLLGVGVGVLEPAWEGRADSGVRHKAGPIPAAGFRGRIRLDIWRTVESVNGAEGVSRRVGRFGARLSESSSPVEEGVVDLRRTRQRTWRKLRRRHKYTSTVLMKNYPGEIQVLQCLLLLAIFSMEDAGCVIPAGPRSGPRSPYGRAAASSSGVLERPPPTHSH